MSPVLTSRYKKVKMPAAIRVPTETAVNRVEDDVIRAADRPPAQKADSGNTGATAGTPPIDRRGSAADGPTLPPPSLPFPVPLTQ
ncbi:hypothetical protein BF14_034155 [Streptomyces griseus]|nr:hypothetical protein DIJ69_33890 [Streptomyces globisporus]PPA38237.1 hypothetical protein BF14_034155 [Streptomyces griseus]RAN13390.1 hypothetical protein A3838_33065 [Streptomyces badius]RAN22181.1 hypothetical protein A3800_33435 [Streptomyces badius]